LFQWVDSIKTCSLYHYHRIISLSHLGSKIFIF